MSFHTFGQCFHLFIDTALQKQKNVLKSYLLRLAITENRIVPLVQVRFPLTFLFRQMVNKLCFLFGPDCIISAYTQDYELKFSTQANFDTMVSNFIFNTDILMTS